MTAVDPKAVIGDLVLTQVALRQQLADLQRENEELRTKLAKAAEAPAGD